jgi:hypothetical protein
MQTRRLMGGINDTAIETGSGAMIHVHVPSFIKIG